VNAQELFLDVSSGRFLDGESAIPTTKPSFFSDEQKRVNISVLKVKNNKVSSVTPSPDSRFKFRLGTQTLKLADQIPISTAPAALITAIGTVSTAGGRQAVITASIETYTPVTAQFIVTRDNTTAVTPLAIATITTFTGVVASISATIGSVTIPNETTQIQIPKLGCAVDFIKAVPGIYFSANLTTVATATFVATITGGVVTTISIIDDGLGYPNGEYALTFSGGSPSVTASATAVASNGEIQSVSIVDGGSGYSSAPSVTLFQPDKALREIVPIGVGYTSIAKTGGTQTINFVGGLRNSVTLGTPISFSISSPDTTSTVTARTQAIATISEQPKDNWTITITSRGYGYVSTPSVTMGDYIVSYAKQGGALRGPKTFELRQGTFSAGSVIQSAVPELPFSQIQKNSKVISKSPSFSGDLTRVTIGYPLTDAGDEAVYSGMGRPPTYETTLVLVPFTRNLPGLSGGQERVGGSIQTGETLGRDRNALFVQSGARPPKISTLNGSLAESQIASSLGWNPIIQDASVVGKKLFYTFTQGGRAPTRHALYSIEFNDLKNYVVEQVGFINGGGRNTTNEQQGGGIFEPIIEEIDAGSGYASGQPLIFTYIGGLAEVSTFYRTRIANRIITLPPLLNTIISTTASVVTSFADGFFNYSIQSGGFGYLETNKNVLVSGGTVTNGIVSATITNSPKGYRAGVYDCTVSAPSSGTPASVQLQVNSSVDGGSGFSVSVINPGSGFTSAPLITAPELNSPSGFVSDVKISNQADNPFLIYRNSLTSNDPIDIVVQQSPVTGGSAEVRLVRQREANGRLGDHIPQIIKAGFGYVTPPTLTAVTPTTKVGQLISAIITNNPVGYIADKTYVATVGTSPEAGGTAVLEFVIASNGQKNAYFQNTGYGYTSIPVVTAPAPDAPNGFLSSIAIATSGLGYAPGTYQCNITQTPSTTGQTAEINFIVNEDGNSILEMSNAGEGYVTAPIISVVTPSGNVISGITITCQGNFYINSTANFQIDDLSGSDVVLDDPVIEAGKIMGINVIRGGYGFSDNPKITFAPPTRPIVGLVPANVIQGDLNITVASANAILSTSTQRDILMEVYETDGTNEQVVAQATVSLAKRVLE
jgi:hypothetical protein